MNFDTLCNIVLEGKKADKFARMVIGNASPVFTLSDVLRDPNDPSKGLKTYLTHRDSKSIDPQDHERLARRALRRLNWVAKSAVKRMGSREISLGKLNEFIIGLLDKYQTKVMGYNKPDKMRTAQEARIIGNLLLPPSKWTPNAKGVFVAVDGPAVGPGKRVKPDTESIVRDFNISVDDYVTMFDPDLIDTIKDIVSGVDYTEDEDIDEIENTDEPFDNEEDVSIEEPTEEIRQESVDSSVEGVTISTILKDPRIKDIYDPRVVRKVIKSMLDIGSLVMSADGMIVLPSEGEEDWRTSYDKWRDTKGASELEEIPQDSDVEELASELGEQEPTDTELDSIEDEEEELEHAPEWGDEEAASRLGYKKPRHDEVEVEDEEDPDEDDTWY